MSMTDWAEKEIEIACARERAGNGTPDGEWDYGVACYQSALKAFKSLTEDGHSGMSIGITKHILNRLIDGKPLTPIVDAADIWDDISRYDPKNPVKKYQCSRMSSLFKDVYPDGTVKYSDVDRVICYAVNSPSCAYTSGLIRNLIDKMYPITMPYSGEKIKVACEDFLTDPKNGDFDTVGIFHALIGDDRVEINQYFKEGNDDWEEIDEAEYLERKSLAKALEEAKNADQKEEAPHC